MLHIDMHYGTHLTHDVHDIYIMLHIDMHYCHRLRMTFTI